MDIILKNRGHGKTVDLIRLSAQTGYPIVCANPNIVELKAKELHLEIPEPITTKELYQMKSKPDGVYIDELGIILERVLGCHVAGFAETV